VYYFSLFFFYGVIVCKNTKLTRSEIKRQDIIDAACQAFQEFGVQATSMDKIAELAQVSKRTVYNHFATKQALVVYLLNEIRTRTLVDVDIDTTYDPLGSVESKLLTLITAEINLYSCGHYIDLTRMAFGHFLYHPEELKRELDKVMAQETAFQRYLRSACEHKQLNIPDIKFATDQLQNLIKGSCFWPQFLKIEAPLTDEQKHHIATESAAMFLARYNNK
jgi:TetR/AcrR family transcriptional regulator, regulator of autoinduction and epiphytic fitness